MHHHDDLHVVHIHVPVWLLRIDLYTRNPDRTDSVLLRFVRDHYRLNIFFSFSSYQVLEAMETRHYISQFVLGIAVHSAQLSVNVSVQVIWSKIGLALVLSVRR